MAALALVQDWQGDETLYSWCARFHLICGNGSARRTSSVLFGAEHNVRERDAPMHLRHFVDATHGGLGSVESILRTRTATGLYWPFLHPHRREQIRTYFEGTSGSGWVTRIGMPASAIAARDLRYCDECVVGDVSTIGNPRWRLAHQLTCAHVCLEHGNPLRTLKFKASTWCLPPVAKAAMGATEEVAWSSATGRILQRLAHLAWSCIGVDAIELDLIRSATLHGLRTEGIASWQFPVDGARLARWFRGTNLARAIRDAQPSESRLADGLWVHALLRRRREEHPVLWLMLWCAIHPDHSLSALTSGFLAPAVSTAIWDEHGQGCLWSTPRFALPPNVMDLILSHGSLKSAAKALGISVFTLRRHLELEGCRGGQFVAEAHASRRRNEALELIRQYVTQHPGCFRTEIHHDCKAAVVWLGRYAKEDLVQLLATIPVRWPRQLDLLRSTSGPMDSKV